MQKFKVDNIYIFGESSLPLTEEDIDLIVSNPTTEFHLLRHYQSLPEAYIDTLVGKSYMYYNNERRSFVESVITKDSIKAGLATIGSKFLGNISGIETPHALISTIKTELSDKIKRTEVLWINQGRYETALFRFDYCQDVGYLGLIELRMVPESRRVQIKKEQRGALPGETEFCVQTLSGVPGELTKTVIVELTKVPNLGFLNITAYPGNIMSPDFPSANQVAEEQKYNVEFWNNHVFVQQTMA
jgi:hypothetical protein